MKAKSRYFPALLACVAALALATLLPVLAPAQAYVGQPKLIVIVVIDQFRGDYLNRDHAEFKGRGFRLFTDEGAWFTDCYFDYANTKTAPGHATIGTGAYTDGHGIETNEWWDASRSFDHKVSSVEDERYQLVDLPAASIPANQPGAPDTALKYVIGASPLNLRATTIGDELRLATNGRSRVYGISLKDRAAILPAGQAANGAFWIDNSSGQFTTSTYYMEHLPEWARAFNASGRAAQAAREAKVEGTTQFFELVGRTPAANSYELDFAKALITGEKLGQNGVTDLVVISLSPNDIQGHQFGPDSDSEEQMILSLDHDLDSFNTWLDQTLGLKNVWLALTADHGIAPIPGEAAKLGIHAAAVDMSKVYLKVNAELNKRHSAGNRSAIPSAGPRSALCGFGQAGVQKGRSGRKGCRGRSGCTAARGRGQPRSASPGVRYWRSGCGCATLAGAAAHLPACAVRLYPAATGQWSAAAFRMGPAAGPQLCRTRKLVRDAGAGCLPNAGFGGFCRDHALQPMVL